MPIILTPLSAQQTAITADVTRVYDRPVPTKQRGFSVSQAQSVDFQFVYLDRYGNPVNLTQQGIVNNNAALDTRIQLNLREAVGLPSSAIFQVQGSVVDDVHGVVTFSLGSSTAIPGVYNAEAGILDLAGNLLLSNRLFLIVESGLFGFGTTTYSGPPTSDELRLAMRDQPELNLLLDTYNWDLAEVALSLVQAVRQFNSALPPLEIWWDTTSMPVEWRYYWSIGAAAFMLETAAAWYRTNAQAVQAAGTQVDDLNRAPAFERAAQGLRARWEQWVKQTRISINMSAGFGAIGGAYRHRYPG
jgi:hypothetical protein